LLLSVCVSVQMPPHTVNPEPGGQELVQVPPWQACPAAQVIPQPPQLAVPVCTTQAPLHMIWYGGHPPPSTFPPVPLLPVPLLPDPLLPVPLPPDPPLLVAPPLPAPLLDPRAPSGPAEASFPPLLEPKSFDDEPPHAANPVATTTPAANVRAIARILSSTCASRTATSVPVRERGKSGEISVRRGLLGAAITPQVGHPPYRRPIPTRRRRPARPFENRRLGS
jgi:hypothetical protein